MTVDLAATLTLQVVAFLQTEADAPRSAAFWTLIPSGGYSADTFSGASARLAGLEKPLVVGALNEPGFVAVWSASLLPAAERRHVECVLQNQLASARAQLTRLACDDSAYVRFDGSGSQMDVPASILRRWLGEYALTWGWRLGAPTAGDHGARLLVLQNGRRWSPGGTCAICPPAA